MPEDVLREGRIWEVVRLFEWCASEGLHPRVNTKDGSVVICSGGYVYEREEEASARKGRKPRSSAWW